MTTNAIAGSSLSANRITLPAGVYRVNASAPAYFSNKHQLKLANITDSSDQIIGASSLAGSGVAIVTRSFLEGVITLASEKTLELQHRCQNTRTSDGFGVQSSFAVVEVYSMIQIEKVG